MSEMFREENYENGVISYACVQELLMAEFSALKYGYSGFFVGVAEIICKTPARVKTKRKILYEEYEGEKDRKYAGHAADKLLKTCNIRSIETRLAYYYVYLVFQRFLNRYKLGVVSKTNIKNVIKFLKIISKIYNKNTVKKYRQALQWILRASGRLGFDECLVGVNVGCEINYLPRFYNEEQFQKLYESCKPKQRISLVLCYYSGLRAHEILTILPGDQRDPDDRPGLETKFKKMDGKLYTVIGKGGLIRLVSIPHAYVSELEKFRVITPIEVVNRGISYTTYYDILGGTKLSSWFSRYSKKILGFSNGVHGLRHSYAQNRFNSLFGENLTINKILKTVSQELGHFRPNITLVYLRGMLKRMIKSSMNENKSSLSELNYSILAVG